MNNIVFFTGLYILAIMITAISQLLLKFAAKKEYKNKVNEYINPLVISAYILFFSTTVLSVICLVYIDLSSAVVIESLGYIFVGILSFVFLKEKFSKRKFIGILLIFIGLIIFAV